MKQINTSEKVRINTGNGVITFAHGMVSVNSFVAEVREFTVKDDTIPTLTLYADGRYVGSIEFSSDELLLAAVNKLTT